jgi:mannose-6-phosphate isomerase-like protein (cupin superfamily)
MADMQPINIEAKLAVLHDYWAPKTVATVNGYEVRLVKVRGEFVQHRHVASDELFLVLDGTLTLRTDDGEVQLAPGELYVVPRGTSHQPVADRETSILLFEPRTVIVTGDVST